MTDTSTLEWQAAEGSKTLHLIDTAKPGGKRTGPQAACGRRPQRGRDWWFGLPIDRDIRPSAASYMLTVCEDCEESLGGDPGSALPGVDVRR